MASSSTSNLLPFTILATTFLIFSVSISPSSSSPEPTIARRAMSDEVFSTQMLAAHNAVRARHRLPQLAWSSKLANYAKWYANQRRKDCRLVHSTGDYGENIFWGQGKRWKATDAVKDWAAQEAYYDYGSDSCMANRDCLHYTQLVWRNTRRVGCARVKCANGDTYVVCEYDPHGNVIGQRPY